MEMYLIRHTRTILGEGLCCGQSDIPVKEPCLDQFDIIAANFKFRKVIIYSSPLKRCAILANYLYMKKESCHAIKFDDRLKEMHFGEWELKKWEELEKGELDNWMADFISTKPPGGECFSDLNQRVIMFLRDLINVHPAENEAIIVITHAGVIRSLLCQILDIPLRNAFKIQVGYGCISKIIIDRKTGNQSIGFINQLS
jgi:alpha-ribazole phosphatase